jgi:hypothetical protein
MKKTAFLIVFACGMLPAQTGSTQTDTNGPATMQRNAVFATPGLVMAGAPEGTITIVAHESSFVSGKPVTGAPYSADQVTEHVQMLADGNRIVNTVTTKVYRDSQGRTRTETSLPPLAGGPTAPVMITIHDPVAGAVYFLNSENKNAQKITGKAVGLLSDDLAGVAPLPPLAQGGGIGPITIGSAPAFAGPDVQLQDREWFKSPLGNQNMQGVVVTGTRTTTTIPAGAIGNEQPIETVSERWFSPALQVVVKSVYTDPRIGQTTETLNNLNRSEPDASLFQVPSDYTITESAGPAVKKFVYKKQQ